MGCLGVLFSLSEKEVKKLKSFKSDKDRLEYLQEEIEKIYFNKFPERVAELDKSWDGLHRSLTDGKYDWNNGKYPLNHVILGGELLYKEDDYIMSLKTPEEVVEIAQAVETVTEEDLKNGYNQILPDDNDYAEFLSDEDFKYTWQWFNSSKEFWRKASLEKRYVLFTADQ